MEKIDCIAVGGRSDSAAAIAVVEECAGADSLEEGILSGFPSQERFIPAISGRATR